MARPVAESLGVAVAFSAGLFSFLSPCVLPLFPSYLSFVTGMSVDRLTSEVSVFERSRILLHSLAFIAGFTAVFVSLGASFSAAGHFFQEYREWIRIGGGVLIVLFGLYIAGVFQWGALGPSSAPSSPWRAARARCGMGWACSWPIRRGSACRSSPSRSGWGSSCASSSATARSSRRSSARRGFSSWW